MRELLSRPEPVCDILEHTEQNYLIGLLGENNYLDLVADLVDYSAAVVWRDEADYVLNDLIIYEGEYYKLNVATSSSSDTPNCNSEWTKQNKFVKACYNEMFSGSGGGLLKILSWHIWAKAAPFYPNPLGLTDFIGQDKEYKQKLNFYLANIYSNIAAMESYLFRWNNINKCVSMLVCVDVTKEQNQTAFQIAW